MRRRPPGPSWQLAARFTGRLRNHDAVGAEGTEEGFCQNSARSSAPCSVIPIHPVRWAADVRLSGWSPALLFNDTLIDQPKERCTDLWPQRMGSFALAASVYELLVRPITVPRRWIRAV